MTSPCDPYAPCEENRSIVISTVEPTGYFFANALYAAGSLNDDDRSPADSAVDDGAVVAFGVTGDADVDEGVASRATAVVAARVVFASRGARVVDRDRRSLVGARSATGALSTFGATSVLGVGSGFAVTARGSGAGPASRSLAERTARRLVAPRTGARGTKTHPTWGIGLPPKSRPSSKSHGWAP
jgi:hypothetical protein